MSYLAIARKYRPATFAEIVGQDHVTRTLRHAIERDRIHHAFLFCGPRGVGKTTAARALAKALNCVHGPTPDPCGACTSCLEITAGSSQDLIEIDGASNNSVDDVRELRDTVQYAPSQGRSKIYLVDEVHMLSNAAFNALLKTLEEPPPHVVFIFATTEPTKIPDTILSRVQRFDFKRIPATGVVERLAEIAAKEGATISDAALRMIARAGEGSMRDAQSLLDKVLSFSGAEVSDELVADTLGLIDRSLMHDMLAGLVTGSPERCLDVIGRVYAFGHEMSVFSAELLELVRNATFVRMSVEARRHVDLPAEEIEQLEELTRQTDTDALTRLFAALMEVHEQVAHASRPRIVLEMAVARLANVRPLTPVGQLVARLEALERRLRHQEAGGRRPGRESSRPVGPARSHRTPTPRPAARGRTTRTRAASTGLSPDASDDERWVAFRRCLRELDPPAEVLASGFARRQGRALIITVDSGRSHAVAKREAAEVEVLDVLRDCYGDGVSLHVEPSVASRHPGVTPELEREVLSDPACQRVLRVLGGKIESIVPHDPGDNA